METMDMVLNQDWMTEELSQIAGKGLWRSLKMVGSPQAERVELNGREVINLCSNNYLGLGNHPRLKEAAAEAVRKYGCGCGSSRLICGNSALYEELEERLAEFKGEERAIVFSTGYQANLGLITVLANKNSVIYSDELNHASIIDGVRLSNAKRQIFKHRDVPSLRRMIEDAGDVERGLIVTESVFSMDGDMAPLKELKDAAVDSGSMMMVDEAHATGVIGEYGRGGVNEEGLSGRLTAVMGTLGKALGSFGAYVCGSKELIDLLINRARSFIFTTALPPAAMGAAIEAINLIESDESLRQALWDNVEFFSHELNLLGFDLGDSASPIMPLMVGGNDETMEFCRRLLERGVHIQGIRPPTVPEGTSRLRISLMATHSRNDLEEALEAIREVGRQLEIID